MLLTNRRKAFIDICCFRSVSTSLKWNWLLGMALPSPLIPIPILDNQCMVLVVFLRYPLLVPTKVLFMVSIFSVPLYPIYKEMIDNSNLGVFIIYHVQTDRKDFRVGSRLVASDGEEEGGGKP